MKIVRNLIVFFSFTILDVFVSQSVRRCPASTSVPGSGDGARIGEMIADASRYLILRGGNRGIIFISHCRLR